MGRLEESTAAYHRAQALDPLSPIINALAEHSYAELGQYDRAIEGLRRVVAEFPDFRLVHTYLADVYQKQGRFEESFDLLEQDIRLAGGSSEAIRRMRQAYASGGVREFWREQLKTVLQQTYPSPYIVARHYADLGDHDRALEWLDKAYVQRDRFLIFVRVHPQFEPLASDARFQDLLQRVGL